MSPPVKPGARTAIASTNLKMNKIIGIFAVTVLLLGCQGCHNKTTLDGVHQDTWTISGCEYLVFEEGFGTYGHVLTVTHKGNCSNPIHLR